MKKLFSIILASLIIFTLVGCNASEPKEDSNDMTKNVEIQLWEQMEPANQEIIDGLIVEYMAVNPNIKVTRTHYSTEELRTNFQTAALAGGGPDLVYGPDDNVGIFLVSELIQPITNVVSEDFLKNFDKNSLEAGMMDGKYYEIPMTNGNQIAMIYNKALVKEVPEEWDDFVEMAMMYQKNDNANMEENTYGFLYNSKEPFWFVGLFNGYGGRVMDEDLKPTLNTESMVKALQLVADIRDKYKLGEVGMDYEMPDTMFKQGKSAYILNGAWSWSAYKEAGIDLGIAPSPKMPNDGGRMMFYSSTKGFVIPEYVKDDKSEAVKSFIEFIMSAENNGKYALAASEAPAVMAARDLDVIKNDELQQASIATIEYTIPMPIVPQMRAIWDAMRPELEAVINGSETPKEAAAKMQENAELGISTILNE